MNSPEDTTFGKKKISGTVVLGEQGKYAIQRIQASVNGGGYGDVTHKNSGSNQGDGDTIYEWYHEFEPWANLKPRDQWVEGDGYTFKLKASSYNAEDDYAFYFSSLNLNSVDTASSLPTFNFSVPKDHIQRIKDNLSHFEIWLDSQKYLTNISPDLINTDDGKVSVSASTTGVTIQAINLPAGEHEAKVKAVDNWGHGFESNSVSFTTDYPIYSAGTTQTNTTSWFPLQINKITGVNTGILSNFNLGSVKSSYTTTTLYPAISGIAFAGATVTMTVSNSSDSSQSKTFTALVGEDSTFSLSPTLYANSIISISVAKDGLFNSLPSFSLKLVQPASEEVQGASAAKQEEEEMPAPSVTPSPIAQPTPTPEPQEDNKHCLWFVCW